MNPKYFTSYIGNEQLTGFSNEKKFMQIEAEKQLSRL